MRLRLRRFYAGKWDEGTVIINGNPEARFSGVILGSPSGGGSIVSVFRENGDRDLEKRLSVFITRPESLQLYFETGRQYGIWSG